jgi:hypothetical protein
VAAGLWLMLALVLALEGECGKWALVLAAALDSRPCIPPPPPPTCCCC